MRVIPDVALKGEVYAIIKGMEPQIANDPMSLFKKEAPDVAAAFDDLIVALVALKGLDAKTKQLIYIALKAADGDTVAVKFHCAMAKELGAQKDEVIGALLITLTVCGLKGVASCLPIVNAEFWGK